MITHKNLTLIPEFSVFVTNIDTIIFNISTKTFKTNIELFKKSTTSDHDNTVVYHFLNTFIRRHEIALQKYTINTQIQDVHHMMCYCSSVIALGSRWSALRMACFVACLSMCLRVAFSAKFWLGKVDRILFNQNPGLNQFSTNFFEFSRLRKAVRPTF
ncbi:hypothetical protein T08_5181 [Trichinella sp. T8]|nr:hypothetical protein T08_5181 [Trichinella sp. T8]